MDDKLILPFRFIPDDSPEALIPPPPGYIRIGARFIPYAQPELPGGDADASDGQTAVGWPGTDGTGDGVIPPTGRAPQTYQPPTSHYLTEDPISTYLRIEREVIQKTYGEEATQSDLPVHSWDESVTQQFQVSADPPSDSQIAPTAEPRSVHADSDTSVPVVDDSGRPVLDRDGKPMVRPAGFPAPDFFVSEGLKDRKLEEALLSETEMSGGGAAAAYAYRAARLANFAYGPWDAQRTDGRHMEYRDYATVVIGLYAAANGMTLDETLSIENSFAAIFSRFRKEKKYDPKYTYLPVQNVTNTVIGFDLYESGRIGARAP